MKKENNSTGEAAPKNEVKEVSILPKPDELKKHLEEQIKKFNHLNKLVNDREIFLHKKEELNGFLTKIRTEARGNNLETNVCKLSLENGGYREDGLKITNAFIIEKCIRFIDSEINEKVKILESEILAAS
jgi:hypothetical protein